MRARRPLIMILVAILAAGVVGGYPPGRAVPAVAANGTLPGGTPIAVTIDTPADGAVQTPGPVTVTGTATVGAAVPIRDTALVTVLDVSGSTRNTITGVTCPGRPTNRILDCEVSAATALNQAAIDAGSVAQVGAVAFSETARAGRVVPAGGDLTAPDADLGGSDSGGPNGVPDMTDVLSSAFTDDTRQAGDPPTTLAIGGFRTFTRVGVGNGLTLFSQAVVEAVRVLQESAQSRRLIAFMSDGTDETTDTDLNRAFLEAHVPADVPIFTFAVGQNTCGGSDDPNDPVDPPDRTLALIAKVTHGRCLAITSPNLGDLPAKLAEVVASHLIDVQLTVDGQPTSLDTVTPPLSADPKSVQYTATVNGLTSGTHRICATSTGRDARGQGTATECHNVTIDVPPTVDPGGPYAGLQGAQVPIAGTAADPDDRVVVTRWAAEPGPAVTPGATCTIADPAALATTISCTAPGVYTLTLTAEDSFERSATAGTTVTISNAPPQVSAGGPYTGIVGQPVALTGTVADPDSPELGLQWAVLPPAGTEVAPCSFTDATALTPLVTCTAPGAYTLTLTVGDGENDPVTATTTLVITPARVPVASLAVAAAVAPATAFVGGDPVTVTYTVRNDGEVPMPAVRLAATLPAALPAVLLGPTVVTPAPAGAPACQPAAGCDLGTLDPGKKVTVAVRVLTTAPLDAQLPATVTTTGPDTNAADNTAKARVLIRQPVLTVSPTVGPQGLVTRATGTGFPAGATIRLTWSVGISQTPGEVRVARDGTLDAQVLVFPHDQLGFRVLTASPVRGPKFGPVDSEPFLVQHRPLQPPLLPH